MESVFRLIFLFILTSHFLAFSQIDNKEDLKNVYSQYLEDIKKLSEETNRSRILNNSMLNIFFRNEITSFAKNIKDLSIEKNFAAIDTESKELTLGRSEEVKFWFGKKKTVKDSIEKLSHIFTPYVKIPTSEGFGKILDKEKKNREQYHLAPKIGMGLKYTYIHKGSIFIDRIDKARMIYARNENFITEIKKEIQKYLDNQFDKDLESKIITKRMELLEKYLPKEIKVDSVIDKSYWEKNKATDDEDSLTREKNKASRKLYEEKFSHFYKKIADKEMAHIINNKLYNLYRVGWYGCDIYVPFQNTVYSSRIDTSVTQSKDTNFAPWKIRGFYNLLLTKPKGESFIFGLDISIFNNNNFIRNENETFLEESLINQYGQDMDIYVYQKEEEFYIGDYKDFAEYSLKGEISCLFFKNIVGLSVAGELSVATGYKRHLNWKFGIPVSLKDKDGKPTVNFELQFKEIANNHMTGISLAYNFGRYLK